MKKIIQDETQQKAIQDIDHNLLLISGPGTGKTNIIARKVAYLLDQGYPTTSILITTFTNKATDELKLRVARYSQKNHHHLNINTIHSFCHQIIKEFSHFLSSKKDLKWMGDYHLVGEIDQKLLLLQHFNHLEIKENHFQDKKTFYQEIFKLFGLYSALNENLVERHDLWQYLNQSLNQRTLNRGFSNGIYLTDKQIYNIFEQYRRFMGSNYWLDHSQVLKTAFTLIKNHPDVRNTLQKKYRYILVDEYQDTSLIQHEIFKLLVGESTKICAVGDDDQSIYSFRGATVDNLLNFEQEFAKVKTIVIGENYRSTENIVHFADGVIHENKRRYSKNLLSNRGPGVPVMLIEGENYEQCARLICQTIKKLIEKKAISSYSDVALLFKSVRWGFIGPGYKAVFDKEGIPCVVHRSGNYFEQNDVRFFLEMLRILSVDGEFPRDILLEIVEKMKLSDESMALFLEKSKATWTFEEISPTNIEKLYHINDPMDQQKLLKLYSLYKEATEKPIPILNIIYTLVELFNYFTTTLLTGNESSFYQMAYFTSLAESYGKWGNSSLKSFVENLFVFKEKRTLEEIPVETNTNAVNVSTIHNVKGLQYKAVFVCDFDPTFIGKETFSIPDSLLKGRRDPNDELENNYRLLYVSLTRAMDYLFIANSKSNRYGNPISRKPFLSKALKEARIINLDWNKIHPFSQSSQKEEPLGCSITISYSGYNTYVTCPFRYQLEHVYHFIPISEEKQLLGTLVHKVLEKIHTSYLQGYSVTKQDIIELLNFLSKKQGFQTQISPENVNFAKEMLLSYYSHFSSRFSKILMVEKEFEVFMGDHRLVGHIDLVLQTENKGIEIVDFKTGSINGSVEDQLLTYALAFELESEKKIDCLTAHYLKDNSIYSFVAKEEKLKELRFKLKTVLEQIANQNFSPCPSQKSCPICPFQSCCSYSF